MPSSDKTNIGLNKWVLTDKPKMADFNSDNQITSDQIVELKEEVSEQFDLLANLSDEVEALDQRVDEYEERLDGLDDKTKELDQSIADAKEELYQRIAQLIGSAPETLDTLEEIAEWILEHEDLYMDTVGEINLSKEAIQDILVWMEDHKGEYQELCSKASIQAEKLEDHEDRLANIEENGATGPGDGGDYVPKAWLGVPSISVGQGCYTTKTTNIFKCTSATDLQIHKISTDKSTIVAFNRDTTYPGGGIVYFDTTGNGKFEERALEQIFTDGIWDINTSYNGEVITIITRHVGQVSGPYKTYIYRWRGSRYYIELTLEDTFAVTSNDGNYVAAFELITDSSIGIIGNTKSMQLYNYSTSLNQYSPIGQSVDVQSAFGNSTSKILQQFKFSDDKLQFSIFLSQQVGIWYNNNTSNLMFVAFSLINSQPEIIYSNNTFGFIPNDTFTEAMGVVGGTYRYYAIDFMSSVKTTVLASGSFTRTGANSAWLLNDTTTIECYPNKNPILIQYNTITNSFSSTEMTIEPGTSMKYIYSPGGNVILDVNKDVIDEEKYILTDLFFNSEGKATIGVATLGEDGKLTLAQIPSGFGGGTGGDYAPTNHKSSSETYGVGNGSEYGHLALQDSVTSTNGVDAGFAATPNSVKSAYDQATTALNTTNSKQADLRTTNTISLGNQVTNKTNAIFDMCGNNANPSAFTFRINSSPTLNNFNGQGAPFNFAGGGEPRSDAAATTNTGLVRLQEMNAAVNGRAPAAHASTATTYGVGNASYFGHVKLSDSYTSSGGNAAAGVGASSAAVYNTYNTLNTRLNNVPSLTSANTWNAQQTFYQTIASQNGIQNIGRSSYIDWVGPLGGMYLYSNNGGYNLTGSFFAPAQNAFSFLGNEGYRWSQIYSVSGTINTSDENEKREITPLDTPINREFARRLVPKAYKFKAREDGDPGVRYHFGFIAQDVEKLMEELGMDSVDFAGFIKSPIYKKDNGKDTDVLEKYIYSLRYSEFIPLCFLANKANEEEIQELKESLNQQEERIKTLEEKLNKLTQ